MKLKTPLEITGIGSVPHASEKRACDAIFPNFRKIPFWPQLVNKSALESMTIQFSERMPGIEVNAGTKEIFVNRNCDIAKEIDTLERHCASGDLEYFSISEDYASGFYEYMYRLKDHDNAMIDYLKGQITGPISFGLAVTDEDRVPLFFDKDLFEAAVKTLSLRAKWQAARLKRLFKDIIIFVDEPSLSFFKENAKGSKIKKDDLTGYVKRMTGAIHEENCYAGIHCCGDADWDMAMSCGIDILNFDAYNYADSFIRSYEKISDFISNGGIIAWGLVPTATGALKESADELVEKLEKYISRLSEKGILREDIIKSSLITPSCGLGALDEKVSTEVIKLCAKVSERAKERIG